MNRFLESEYCARCRKFHEYMEGCEEMELDPRLEPEYWEDR